MVSGTLTKRPMLVRNRRFGLKYHMAKVYVSPCAPLLVQPDIREAVFILPSKYKCVSERNESNKMEKLQNKK